MVYEYIRLVYDGSLEELNGLAVYGWELKSTCTVRAMSGRDETHFILGRRIALQDIQKVREHHKPGPSK